MNFQIEALQVLFEDFTPKKQDTIEAWFQVQALFFFFCSESSSCKEKEQRESGPESKPKGQNLKWVTKLP
jgi:hypothetical protein